MGEYRQIRGLGPMRFYHTEGNVWVAADSVRAWSPDVIVLIERFGWIALNDPAQVHHPKAPKKAPTFILENGIVIHKAAGGWVATAPAYQTST